MYDIITIGSATRDVFVKSTAFETHENLKEPSRLDGCFPLGEKIELENVIFETGGGSTNAAVTFSRLGYRTATITAVGNDVNGTEIFSVLKKEKIATSFIQKIPKEQTAFSIIIVAGSGERTVLVLRGASQSISPKKIPWSKIHAKWFYISSLGGNLDLMQTIINHAHRSNIRIAWNPGSKELKQGIDVLTPLIRGVDVFNLNKEEAGVLLKSPSNNLQTTIASLRPLPHHLLLVTDGQNGAYAASKDLTLHSGTIDVPRINATGAGDAFGSGVIAGLLRKDDIAYSLAVGTQNATGVVQQMGAKRGILHAFPSSKALQEVIITPWQ